MDAKAAVVVSVASLGESAVGELELLVEHDKRWSYGKPLEFLPGHTA